MGTLLFILFWVVLALALLFLALRGGRRARPRRRVRSRGMSRKWTLGLILSIAVLGIIIPGLIILSFSDTNEASGANVPDVELTAQEAHGLELFGQRCRNCHTLAAANASAAVGPNLDELRPPYELTLNAIEEGRSRGNGQMPADLVEGEDAEAVAAFVAKATGAAGPAE